MSGGEVTTVPRGMADAVAADVAEIANGWRQVPYLRPTVTDETDEAGVRTIAVLIRVVEA